MSSIEDRIENLFDDLRELFAELRASRPQASELMSSAQWAKSKGISQSTVQKWAKDPTFPAINIGRASGKGSKLRIYADKADRWMTERWDRDALTAAEEVISTPVAPESPPSEDEFAAFLAEVPTDIDTPSAEPPETLEESEGLSLDSLFSDSGYTVEDAKKFGIIA